MNQVIQVWPFDPLVGTFPTNLSKRYKYKGMSRVPGSDVRIKEVMNGSMGLWLTDPYKGGYIYWGGKKKTPHPKTWWVIPHLQLGIPHIYQPFIPIYTPIYQPFATRWVIPPLIQSPGPPNFLPTGHLEKKPRLACWKDWKLRTGDLGVFARWWWKSSWVFFSEGGCERWVKIDFMWKWFICRLNN